MAVRKKALKFGAVQALIVDAKDEFAQDFISLGIKANAHYQGEYHLSTPIGRAILAKKAVEAAGKIGADAIAHGCTGKGNDQVRLDGYMLTLYSEIKIIAPVREWDMDRLVEIAYAQKYGIPVPASVDFPYSVDDNMWGMTWEGGEIEDPGKIPPVKRFLTTYTRVENAPNIEECITLSFEKGLPVALNSQKLKLSALIQKLNLIAGKHGVGLVHLLEDRLVGLKTRGVYELPAAHVIIEAHRNLEKYVSTRTLNQLKAQLDVQWGYLCYAGLWYDPIMQAINAFNKQVNEKVSGMVTVRLFKGQATVVALESPNALDYVSFDSTEGYSFNTNCSASFIEVYSLQMRLANQVGKAAKQK